MDIGVREFKKRFSEILERASRGEVIRVTDRGRPKAVLGPVPGRLGLDAGIADGWVRPGDGSPSEPARRYTSRRSIAGTLDEDRGA